MPDPTIRLARSLCKHTLEVLRFEKQQNGRQEDADCLHDACCCDAMAACTARSRHLLQLNGYRAQQLPPLALHK